LLDSSTHILRGGRIILPASETPTSQMPQPDICLIISLAFIYRYLRPPMQMLFNADALFSVKQICNPKNSPIYGKIENNS
jgi:hypothetical protein